MDGFPNRRLEDHPRNSARHGKPLTFLFEGRRLRAYEGESVAVALIANGFPLLSRGAKLHRPRGLFCSSATCGKCLMRIDGIPNTQACRTRCRQGMSVVREPGFPGASFDLLRVLDFFYSKKMDYHTLWTRPRWLNRGFTSMVRRFSGMGRLPDIKPPHAPMERLDTDILVVGAGPAGISAALEAAAAGVRVLLVDGSLDLGGHLGAWMEEAQGSVDGAAWVDKRREELTRAGVELRLESEVIGCFEEGFFVVRRGRGLMGVRPRQKILCTGMYDQNLLFEGNDLPGVISTRALSALIARWGLRPAERVAIVGSGAFALSLALKAPEAGIRVVGLFEDGDALRGPKDLARRVGKSGTPVYLRHKIRRALGLRGVKGARFSQTGSSGKGLRFPCDSVAIDAKGAPSWELAAQAGAAVEYRGKAGGFVVRHDALGRTRVPGLFVAGEMTGAGSLDDIVRAGRLAAARAVHDIGGGGRMEKRIRELAGKWERE